MDIIDSWVGATSASIAVLKTNQFVDIPATQISGNYFEATTSAISGYATNLKINFKSPVTTSGSVTLNINSYGVKSLVKVNSSGTLVNLASGDIILNKYYMFNYNGTYFVLMNENSSSGSSIQVSGSSLDNGVVKFMGTGGSIVKSTGVTIDSSSNLNLNGNQIQNYAEKSLVTSQGTTYNIDWSAANLFEITLTNNIGLTFSNLVGGKSITALLIQDGTGGRTITSWPSVKWTSGSVPTLSSGSTAVDVFTFLTRSAGSTVLGFPAGLDMK
jgi:hypothetical protein